MGLLLTLAKALKVFWAFYRAGSHDVTLSLGKRFCLVRHKILSFSRTSGVGGRVVEEFRSCCCFLVSYFLSFGEEFRSCLSNPERSVCHFGLSIGRAVMTAVCYIFGFHY